MSNFVTAKTLSTTVRNNETGGHGMQITVGASDIWVTALGRNFHTGNTGTHRVWIGQSISGQLVFVAGVDIAMTGGVNGAYTYATLAVPAYLRSGQTYYILSDETSSGDQWLDFDSSLTVASVATLNSGGLHISPFNSYVTFGSSGNCYVPLDFQYVTADPTSFSTYVSSVSAGTDRSSFSTYIGMRIYCQKSITVYSLGRWVAASNSLTHNMFLVDNSNATLASTSVSMSGATPGTFKYSADFGSPVTLSAGNYYYIYSQEGGADHFLDDDTVVAFQSEAAYAVASVFSSNIGSGPSTHLTAAIRGQLSFHTYGPLDFKTVAAPSGFTVNPILSIDTFMGVCG